MLWNKVSNQTPTSGFHQTVSWSLERGWTGCDLYYILLWNVYLQYQMSKIPKCNWTQPPKEGCSDISHYCYISTNIKPLTFSACLTCSLSPSQVNQILHEHETGKKIQNGGHIWVHQTHFPVAAYQMEHNNGAVWIFTRCRVTPVTTLQDLRKSISIISSTDTRNALSIVMYNKMSHHAENCVRTTASLVHFCLSIMAIL